MTAAEEAELRQLIWVDWQKKKCAAKTKFYSAEAAQVHDNGHRKHTPPKLWSYQCAWCGFWHMTSSRPREERRAA